jgi:SNF2 family DNA or RNA helicase
MKAFGNLKLQNSHWELSKIEPHVLIKLKAIFEFLPKSKFETFDIPKTPECSRDLLWFTDRYPLNISEADQEILKSESATYLKLLDEAEAILAPNRIPREIKLKEGKSLRDYQAAFVEFFSMKLKMILGDILGIGKTISAIGVIVDLGHPVIVVCQSHLTNQWKSQIESFTNLKVHIAKTTKPYTIIDSVDVLIIPYSKLSGWTNALVAEDFRSYFKGIIFDEIQELRHVGTGKSEAAKTIVKSAEFVLGLTGTPIYNYGIEAFNVFNLVKPGCLSTRDNFSREWCEYGDKVKNPKALGSYLRANHLFLRRTWEDVNIDRTEPNRVTIPVDTNASEIEKIEDRARSLALTIFTGEFTARGEAARQLDIMLRQATGVAKARGVSDVVRLLLNDEKKILLAGWHRDVYDIWNKELAEFGPVMYTGSESPSQKEKSKESFVNGESRVMIISLRSGVGLDGLQKVCNTVVFGELDWSPAVHDQVIGRLHRDGQERSVQAYFCVSEEGSDPSIVSVLGLKSSQASGIIDPFSSATEVNSDSGRIKEMARQFLNLNVGKEIQMTSEIQSNNHENQSKGK